MRRYHRTTPRRGMTLVEILVVMGLIATLSAMVMVIAPSALEKDRTTAAVNQLEGALQISRARAMRDGLPRGIRLVWNGAQCNSFQFIEVRPAFVANPGGPAAVPPYPIAGPNPVPYVQFNYTLNNNSVSARECRVYGLLGTPGTPGNPNGPATDHAAELVGMPGGGTLYLPTIGTWHTFNAVSGPVTDNTFPNQPMPYYVLSYNPPPSVPPAPPNPDRFGYPDSELGTATVWRTNHWGIYTLPLPLLGEPTLELPQDTCVDFTQSQGPVAGSDYDILFAPNGQLVRTGPNSVPGHVFLWVRDPGRPANLPQGGEQLIVVIKTKSGAVGAAPPDWGTDPFSIARQKVAGN